jgi:Zn-finger nucleic acid-binding protein
MSDTRGERPCPRCSVALQARTVGNIVIDECSQCLGLFLDQAAIQQVIADREQTRAEALLESLPRAEVKAVRPGEKMYVKCPCCGTIMNRKLFAMGAGVVIDVCKAHGTFFDVGELPVIIEFVMKGGLEKAQKTDLERKKQELQREKASLHAAHMHYASIAAHHQSSGGSPGGALVELLFALFG